MERVTYNLRIKNDRVVDNCINWITYVQHLRPHYQHALH